MISKELKGWQSTFIISWRIWNGSKVFIEKIALNTMFMHRSYI